MNIPLTKPLRLRTAAGALTVQPGPTISFGFRDVICGSLSQGCFAYLLYLIGWAVAIREEEARRD